MDWVRSRRIERGLRERGNGEGAKGKGDMLGKNLREGFKVKECKEMNECFKT